MDNQNNEKRKHNYNQSTKFVFNSLSSIENHAGQSFENECQSYHYQKSYQTLTKECELLQFDGRSLFTIRVIIVEIHKKYCSNP